MKLRNPKWIDQNLLSYNSLDEVPDEQFTRIKTQLGKAVSENPIVSVVIAAYNEEVNVLRCVDSLSKNESRYPFEIIVVNNNSKDRTQETLDRMGVQNYFQKIQGCGPARQMGQEQAKGKYILLADADCFYPRKYIETLTEALQQKGVAVVYGNYSFLSESSTRLQFAAYEGLRNIMIRIRHIKRPYLNTLGISMGYVKEYGLKEGYIGFNTRGDDGRLTFDLMKYGKVKYVKSSKNQVWTGSRTLAQDGSLLKAFFSRILREISMLDRYFVKEKPHDTKNTITTAEEYSMKSSVGRLKKKVSPLGKKKDE